MYSIIRLPFQWTQTVFSVRYELKFCVHLCECQLQMANLSKEHPVVSK